MRTRSDIFDMYNLWRRRLIGVVSDDSIECVMVELAEIGHRDVLIFFIPMVTSKFYYSHRQAKTVSVLIFQCSFVIRDNHFWQTIWNKKNSLLPSTLMKTYNSCHVLDWLPHPPLPSFASCRQSFGRLVPISFALLHLLCMTMSSLSIGSCSSKN